MCDDGRRQPAVSGGGCATLSDIYAAQPADEEAVFVTDANSTKLDIGTEPTGFWLVRGTRIHASPTGGATT